MLSDVYMVWGAFGTRARNTHSSQHIDELLSGAVARVCGPIVPQVCLQCAVWPVVWDGDNLCPPLCGERQTACCVLALLPCGRRAFALRHALFSI
jgi:hypothetical protein